MGVIDNLEVITEMSRAIVWGGDLFFVRFGQLLGEVIVLKKGFSKNCFDLFGYSCLNVHTASNMIHLHVLLRQMNTILQLCIHVVINNQDLEMEIIILFCKNLNKSELPQNKYSKQY